MSSESNTRAIVGGIAAVVMIGAIAFWFDQSRDPVGGIELVIVSDENSSEPVEAVPEAAVAAAGPTDIDAGASTDAADDDAEAPGVRPTFDTFFRNPDETTIIAGRATPGQTISILLSGAEIDRVVAEADGTFGTVVFIAAADQPRRLSLIGDPDGTAVASAESILVPPSAPVSVAAATPEREMPSDPDATSVAQTPSEGIADDPQTAVAAPPEPTIALGSAPEPPAETSSAPTLIADADGVRVIQPAPSAPDLPVFTDNVALDTITYDPAGEVVLAGRAVAGGFVQVYLNNQPVMTSRISDDGNWQIDLPDVDTGVYTLRVDEIDADGNVQSRVETPFKREEAADVAAILAEETSAEGFDIAVKTVQPGSTLWAIAEETFGEGIMYVAVFEANRDLIRDPDLIYPGQVFRLPEVAE